METLDTQDTTAVISSCPPNGKEDPFVKTSSKDHQNKMTGLSMLLIGVLVGSLHYYHVKTLYENDRHFSHLSNIEREMCFRSEMGLYYSFYKRMVSSPSLKDGLYQLTYDNLTEYPDTINALSKFNIYPEAMIGGMWRLYLLSANTFGWSEKQCYMINRGEGWPPVESCVGLGEPILFYLEVVWIFSGLTAFLLYYYGSFLSGSQIGGCLTILLFFTNHTECTRVQWTPPLRESFAYPLIILHCVLITAFLQDSVEKSLGQSMKWKGLMTSFSSCFSLLFWQFSQFILTCEIAILIAMYVTGIIERKIFSKILTWISIGFLLALFGLRGNSLLLYSFLSAILASAWIFIAYEKSVKQNALTWNSLLRIVSIIVFSIVVKLLFPNTGNDSHIVKIFMSKVFPDSNNFHTLMYTCAPEFQGLPWSYALSISKSCLLPLLLVTLLLVLWQPAFFIFSLLRKCLTRQSVSPRTQNMIQLKDIVKHFEPAIVYNICLLIVFFILSMMAMRLKLFLTPQMCVLVSLISSSQVMKSIPILINKKKLKYLLLFIIFSTICHSGMDNLRKQRSIEGEYSNYPLEELLTWIQMKTKTSDVFAGPMPIMASILLSTGRPIVNHPYYEDEAMRNRTVQVYSLFSRKTRSEAFESILGLGANFAVLEASKCFDHMQPRGGCKMTDLWDIEDPENKNRPSLCPSLFKSDAYPFERVFSNSEYVVLKVSPK